MYNKLTKIVKEDIAAYKNKKWIDFVDSLGKNPVGKNQKSKDLFGKKLIKWETKMVKKELIKCHP